MYKNYIKMEKEEIKMPTAEEFSLNYGIIKGFSIHSNTSIITENHHKCMTEFAKLHVQEALEQAYDKAELIESGCNDENRCCMSNDMGDSYALSKHSIITSYPLENIK